MNADELRTYLTAHNIPFEEKEFQYGRRFKCSGDEIFNCYDSGKFVAQGKNTALRATIEALAGHVSSAVSKTIFVVYGHDDKSLHDLELILHKMGFKPVVLSNLVSGGDTIIEKLEQHLSENGQVGYACVLLTPDDEGHRFDHPTEKKPRARQNVVLELGTVLMRLGRSNVCILTKEGIEHPSDIGGIIYTAFKDNLSEVRNRLFQSLTEAGFKPDPKGLV